MHRTRALVGVIAAMVVVNLVYGLTLPLLSLVLDSQGISKTVIGLSILTQASAGVLLAPLMPKWILRFGPGRTMQQATLLAAATLVLLGLIQNVYAWFPLRFLLGAAAALLWATSETVVNELAEESWRGRIIGIYGAAGAAGFALGPLVLILTGSEGLLPFMVTAALVVVASLPLLWVTSTSHTSEQHSNIQLLPIFRLAPYIMLLNITYAAAVEAFIAFFPLYGIDLSLGEVTQFIFDHDICLWRSTVTATPRISCGQNATSSTTAVLLGDNHDWFPVDP